MAEHSYFSILEYSVFGTSWIEVAEIKDMNLTGAKRTMSNANFLHMPYPVMRKKPGLIDAGEFTFNAHVVAGQMTRLAALLFIGVCDPPLYFRVTHPCVRELEYFRGYFSSLGETFPEDDLIMVAATITLTGTPTNDILLGIGY